MPTTAALVIRMIGGVDGIVEVRPLDGSIAVPDGAGVAQPHPGLPPGVVDRADVPDGLRDEPGHAGKGPAVCDLCLLCLPLHVPRVPEDQGEHHEKEQGKAAVSRKQDHKDADNLHKVRNHADDAVVKQVLDGVHVADKPGGDSTRILHGGDIRGEACQLQAEVMAQPPRDLLSEHREEDLL